MKDSIKNFYLSALNESKEDFYYMSENTIGEIDDVIYDSNEDYIKIDFKTSYGKSLTFLSKLSDFKKWLSTNSKKGNVFLDFLKEFMRTSTEEKEEQLDEIIDDDGNIMPSDVMPNNSTNSMVGANHYMDLEKIFLRSMPKSVRNYSGNLGLGTVVW